MALGNKKKGNAHAAWRPDFRDPGTLPDTKAIRTGFIVNFFSIILVVALGSWYGIQEYNLQVAAADYYELEEQVSSATPGNNRLLKANQTYNEVAAPIKEVLAFKDQPFAIADLFAQISALKPATIIFSKVDILSTDRRQGNKTVKVKTVELSGRLTGTEEESPSDLLAGYQESLATMEAFAGERPEMNLVRFSRNNEFGYFDFTLQMILPAD